MFNWFRRAPKQERQIDPVIVELLSLIRDTQQSNGKLMEQVLAQQASNVQAQAASTEMLSKWFGMFTVPNGPPNSSTSLEDREALAAIEKATDWEPINFSPFEGLD